MIEDVAKLELGFNTKFQLVPLLLNLGNAFIKCGVWYCTLYFRVFF